MKSKAALALLAACEEYIAIHDTLAELARRYEGRPHEREQYLEERSKVVVERSAPLEQVMRAAIAQAREAHS